MTTASARRGAAVQEQLDDVRLLHPATPALAEHLARRGPLPVMTAAQLRDEIAASGLTGRGGAAFPTHRKMSAVLAGPAPRVAIANAAEGEPASGKDKTLLARNPHLVLDGLQVAARAVEASSAFLYVHDEPRLVALARAAVAERAAAGIDPLPVTVVAAPARFVSGEESAVASRVSGGPALPRPKPPRVFESGAFGRPTLVQNAETLAHLAVIARNGAAEFRRVGPPEQPGTMLFTVSGAVHQPGIIEAPIGTPLATVIDRCGGMSTHVQAVLLGGYHGSWVPWPDARDLVLANAALQPQGLAVGAGVVVLLPADACGPGEVARVLAYLAEQSAGQCGPCVFGMPALARSYGNVVRRGRTRHVRRVADLSDALARRGGCSHPDGSLRFIRSAAAVFADHQREHAAGRCGASRPAGVLPIPG